MHTVVVWDLLVKNKMKGHNFLVHRLFLLCSELLYFLLLQKQILCPVTGLNFSIFSASTKLVCQKSCKFPCFAVLRGSLSFSFSLLHSHLFIFCYMLSRNGPYGKNSYLSLSTLYIAHYHINLCNTCI